MTALQPAPEETISLAEQVEQLRLQIEELENRLDKELSEDRKRIFRLENKQIEESATSRKHLDNLFESMEIIGRKQVSFSEAAKILNVTKSRVHQLKPKLYSDNRFKILKSESHKQKELIRLAEYEKK